MSLRGRLLLAVGAVALVALLTADVATYSALKNFLYDRVDQSLESAHQPLEQGIDGHGPRGLPDPGRFASGTYVQIRADDGSIAYSTQAVFRGADEYTPKIPDQVELPDHEVGRPESVRFLTVGSVEEGGPDFRVRASSLQDGGQLLIAVPLDDTAATLNRLLTVEILVTVGALIAA